MENITALRSTSFILLFLILFSCKKSSNVEEVETIPKLSFNDISIIEGNGSITTVTIKLTLDHPYSKTVGVSYSTVPGSARSPEDFEEQSDKIINFKPKEVEKEINLYVVADDWREDDESFEVKFAKPFNIDLAKNSCLISIKNDDTKIVTESSSGYVTPISYPGYTLVWGDEFDGPDLNASNWTEELGDGCPAVCGWGSNQLQYYTNNSNNLFFQAGKLVIEGRAESFGGKNYTSARLTSRNKKAFKFGRIDMRAILPKGTGYWPAFWLLPQDNVFGAWPKSGEIDIMEHRGSESRAINSTVHFGNGPASTNISKTYILPFWGTFFEQFHVFSMEWNLDEIKWYVDDILYSTIKKSDFGSNNYPFNEQFYFNLSLAIGGNFAGSPDANTIFPRWFIIDYIRVFQ